MSGGGTITATPDGGDVYTITAITGSFTTNCFGGPAHCKQVDALLPPGSIASNDNLLFFPTTPHFDAFGISFSNIQVFPDDNASGNIRYSSADAAYLLTTYGCTLNDCIANVPIVFDVTLASSSTPLPAALPLFATGLGALGLLGWRRKRKATAALAA